MPSGVPPLKRLRQRVGLKVVSGTSFGNSVVATRARPSPRAAATFRPSAIGKPQRHESRLRGSRKRPFGATRKGTSFWNKTGQRTKDRRQRMVRQWVAAGVGEAISSPILCLLSSVLCPNIMIIRDPRRRAFVSRGLPRTEGRNGAAALDEGCSKWKVNGNPFHEAHAVGVFVTRAGGHSCRGHLTQTEGRDDAETPGEGRNRSFSNVKRK